MKGLESSGCEKIFYEQTSSSAIRRPELQAAIDLVREGDVLIITKIDRLARSVTYLLSIVQRLKKKKLRYAYLIWEWTHKRLPANLCWLF